ncbi:hypothetical protein GGI04_005819, partial [Coemansia thaxteri]
VLVGQPEPAWQQLGQRRQCVCAAYACRHRQRGRRRQRRPPQDKVRRGGLCGGRGRRAGAPRAGQGGRRRAGVDGPHLGRGRLRAVQARVSQRAGGRHDCCVGLPAHGLAQPAHCAGRQQARAVRGAARRRVLPAPGVPRHGLWRRLLPRDVDVSPAGRAARGCARCLCRAGGGAGGGRQLGGAVPCCGAGDHHVPVRAAGLSRAPPRAAVLQPQHPRVSVWPERAGQLVVRQARRGCRDAAQAVFARQAPFLVREAARRARAQGVARHGQSVLVGLRQRRACRHRWPVVRVVPLQPLHHIGAADRSWQVQAQDKELHNGVLAQGCPRAPGPARRLARKDPFGAGPAAGAFCAAQACRLFARRPEGVAHHRRLFLAGAGAKRRPSRAA